jgi:hypothetical protein
MGEDVQTVSCFLPGQRTCRSVIESGQPTPLATVSADRSVETVIEAGCYVRRASGHNLLACSFAQIAQDEH